MAYPPRHWKSNLYWKIQVFELYLCEFQNLVFPNYWPHSIFALCVVAVLRFVIQSSNKSSHSFKNIIFFGARDLQHHSLNTNALGKVGLGNATHLHPSVRYSQSHWQVRGSRSLVIPKAVHHSFPNPVWLW